MISESVYGYCNTSGPSTSNFSIDEMLAVVRQATSMMDDYRRNRDLDFAKLREQGIGVWVWDRGCGEEWVVADEAYDRLLAVVEQKVDGPISPFGITGVRLWKLVDALAAGFTPHGTTVRDLFSMAIKDALVVIRA